MDETLLICSLCGNDDDDDGDTVADDDNDDGDEMLQDRCAFNIRLQSTYKL